ncbi:MAG: transposase [Synergistaceae bacterium]|nr:transposase [Synergistaceae bacterium]
MDSEDIPEDTPKVYADKAYDSKKIDKFLSGAGIEAEICRKAKRGAPLSKSRERSGIRARVEHVFGAMYQKARDRFAPRRCRLTTSRRGFYNNFYVF